MCRNILYYNVTSVGVKNGNLKTKKIIHAELFFIWNDRSNNRKVVAYLKRKKKKSE